MCKYKDVNVAITKLDFSKRGKMTVFLSDGREMTVPLSLFPDIKHLSKKQREDYMIIDDQYVSFEAMSKDYSVKDFMHW